MAEVQPIEIKAPIEGGNVAPPDTKDLAELQHAEQPFGQELSDAGNDNLIKAAQLTYALREAKAQKQQKAIDDALSKVDFNTADILPQDSPEIHNDIKNLMGTISKNPSILLPDPKNPQSMQQYADFKNQTNQIYQKIDTSKWWAQRDKLNQEHTFGSSTNAYNTPENQDLWNKTINTAGVLDRKLPQFSQKIDYNPDAISDRIEKLAPIQHDKTFQDMIGNQVNDITHNYRSPQSLKDAINTLQTDDKLKKNINDFLLHHKQEMITTKDALGHPVADPQMAVYNLDAPVTRINAATGKPDKYGRAQLQIKETKPLSAMSSDELLNNLAGKKFEDAFDQVPHGAEISLAQPKEKPNIDYDTEPIVVATATGSQNVNKPTPTNIPVVKRWDLDKTGGAPRNIKIAVPQSAYDVNTNKVLSKEDIGAGVWDVDVPYVVQTRQTPSGNYILDPDYKGETKLVNEAIVTRTRDNGRKQTLAIPLSAVSQNIKNSKITLNNINDVQAPSSSNNADKDNVQNKTYTFDSRDNATKQNYNEGDVINIGNKQYKYKGGNIVRVK